MLGQQVPADVGDAHLAAVRALNRAGLGQILHCPVGATVGSVVAAAKRLGQFLWREVHGFHHTGAPGATVDLAILHRIRLGKIINTWNGGIAAVAA
jgi:hypothetical protein